MQMFRNKTKEPGKSYRAAFVGLLVLSGLSLVITVWMLIDFSKEQSIVSDLMRDLPRGSKGAAENLADELKWQFRLTILVVINVVVAGIAVILLWRAYHASQTSLRDFMALASDVISGLDLGIITTDTTGRVTSINRRAVELLDSDSDCVGQPVSQFKNAPLQEFRNEWMSRRSTNMTRDFTVVSGGHSRKLRAYCQVLNNHDGVEIGNVLQLRDVTERVLIEERMRRMERYMGLGSLAAGLHHEIKNPLAALSLHVQLLEEQLESEQTTDENRQMLGVIRTEVTRIGGVLESFRKFASIDSLQSNPVDVVELLRQQIELMRPQAQQQRVRISLEAFEPKTTIVGDQTRLEQVFLNLIINALEAMPDGGTLTIKTQRQSDFLLISFTDTGCGVPANLIDKIFDPYFTTKSNGTGLGLAVCEKIIRQHLGTLDLRTSKEGSTFEISLPTRLPPDSESRDNDKFTGDFLPSPVSVQP